LPADFTVSDQVLQMPCSVGSEMLSLVFEWWLFEACGQCPKEALLLSEPRLQDHDAIYVVHVARFWHPADLRRHIPEASRRGRFRRRPRQFLLASYASRIRCPPCRHMGAIPEQKIAETTATNAKLARIIAFSITALHEALLKRRWAHRQIGTARPWAEVSTWMYDFQPIFSVREYCRSWQGV